MMKAHLFLSGGKRSSDVTNPMTTNRDTLPNRSARPSLDSTRASGAATMASSSRSSTVNPAGSGQDSSNLGGGTGTSNRKKLEPLPDANKVALGITSKNSTVSSFQH